MSFVDLNDSVIAQVRSAADIVDFVMQVTPLKLAGKSYKGLCPFHREKTPSFHVDRDKGLFYCFGCGTGGDVFKFLTLTERFTFPEAVEHVASRVGIELPRRKRSVREADKDDLFDVVDDASLAFHQALGFPDNPAARYLQDRGVPKEIIDKYGFGYAPDSWDYILRRLSGRHGEKKLELAGLVMPRKEKTGYYDRFRNRLMIPIHSDTGALVGFGGRSLDGSDPKYLNSPEGELFNKSRLLYNLHRSKDAMRRIQRAILVEGYFDAIAIDHAGVPGVVASMGTSFAYEQCRLLRRFAENVVISYDGDDAGRAAALRAAGPLLTSGLNVLVLDLDGEKDPDTFIQNRGVGPFMERLSVATDVFRFAIDPLVTRARSMTSREKANLVEEFVPLLRAAENVVVQNDGVQRLADALGVGFEAIWSRVRGKAKADVDRAASAPMSSAEKWILRAALQGKLSESVVGRLREEYFEDPACKTIFSIIKTGLEAGNPIDFHEIQTHLRGEAEVTLLSELTLSDDIDDQTLLRIDENLRPMERHYLERRKLEIQRDIMEAEKAGDHSRVAELLAEKSRMLSTLK
jgi:DNA primase